MDRVLRPYAAAYLDDVIIYSDMWAEHVWWVAAILESLRQAGLTANLKKCAVGRIVFGVPLGVPKLAGYCCRFVLRTSPIP